MHVTNEGVRRADETVEVETKGEERRGRRTELSMYGAEHYTDQIEIGASPTQDTSPSPEPMNNTQYEREES